MTVPPLRIEHLSELVSDTLHLSRSEAEPLASLVLRKTYGNPFFVTQFLRSLVRDGLVAFDRGRRCWGFDVARIERAQITDNVVELMTRRLWELSAPSRDTLMLAACIGNVFSLSTLGTIRQRGVREVAGDLWEAIREGLVVPTRERFEPLAAAPEAVLPAAGPSFRFLHDRVQQAAYALVPEDQRRPLHWRVGQLLLAEVGETVPEDRLFEIVHHLNLGEALLADDRFRTRSAQLNLLAGRKARASALFAPPSPISRAGRDSCPRNTGRRATSWPSRLRSRPPNASRCAACSMRRSGPSSCSLRGRAPASTRRGSTR